MRQKYVNLALSAALAISLPSLSLASDHEGQGDQTTGSSWAFDQAHTQARFSVKHMMISNVHGTLGAVSGKIMYDPAHPDKTTVEASVDAQGIDTGNEKRDGHLRSGDFFNVEKYPALTFKSTKAKKAGKNGLKIWGKLTLRGVTRDVVLEVSDITGPVKGPWGGGRKLGAVATTTINREDFGLTWNKALEAGGVLVGKEVTITLEIQLDEKA